MWGGRMESRENKPVFDVKRLEQFYFSALIKAGLPSRGRGSKVSIFFSILGITYHNSQG